MNTCIHCGAPVPEWRQVCPNCETGFGYADAVLHDGTLLYLKTSNPMGKNPSSENLQLWLYEQLMKKQEKNNEQMEH